MLRTDATSGWACFRYSAVHASLRNAARSTRAAGARGVPSPKKSDRYRRRGLTPHGRRRINSCMTSTWPQYREPFSATIRRTVGIALAVGGIVAWRFGRFDAWPVMAALVLWFSFGGHWVELWFLN